MYKVAICIPTYKRPVMLKKLVNSITESNINKTLIKDVNIIVVDNDFGKTAEPTIKELKATFNNYYKINYYNHPEKGISNARNELIKKAFLLNPDFIIFIDDDEYVTNEWLNELVNTIILNNADAARGPVLAKINNAIPDYVSCWFKRPSYPDNMQLNSLTTGNLILKRASLQKYNVWFDKRFNFIGGEDEYFGIQILKKGFKLFWSANAISYENIPESRANVQWLTKRRYRNASSYIYILKLEKEYFKILKKILVSFVYILVGTSALIIYPFPLKRRFWGIIKLYEGVGGLAGLFNILYLEYK